MNKLLSTLLALSFLVGPALAAPRTELDGFDVSAGKVGIRASKNEYRSAGGTGIATIKYADSVSNNRTYT